MTVGKSEYNRNDCLNFKRTQSIFFYLLVVYKSKDIISVQKNSQVFIILFLAFTLLYLLQSSVSSFPTCTCCFMLTAFAGSNFTRLASRLSGPGLLEVTGTAFSPLEWTLPMCRMYYILTKKVVMVGSSKSCATWTSTV